MNEKSSNGAYYAKLSLTLLIISLIQFRVRRAQGEI